MHKVQRLDSNSSAPITDDIIDEHVNVCEGDCNITNILPVLQAEFIDVMVLLETSHINFLGWQACTWENSVTLQCYGAHNKIVYVCTCNYYLHGI